MVGASAAATLACSRRATSGFCNCTLSLAKASSRASSAFCCAVLPRFCCCAAAPLVATGARNWACNSAVASEVPRRGLITCCCQPTPLTMFTRSISLNEYRYTLHQGQILCQLVNVPLGSTILGVHSGAVGAASEHVCLEGEIPCRRRQTDKLGSD
ncbi:hypothetical protein D3C76_1010790 [compost metagenome]